MKDYHINIFYSEEDEGYIADIPDLKYCSAFGDTPEEALREVLIAKASWLEAARTEGKPIPLSFTWQTTAWSSQTHVSGSQPWSVRACCGGNPFSKSVTRSTCPVTSTISSSRSDGPRSSMIATPSRSRSAWLGGGM